MNLAQSSGSTTITGGNTTRNTNTRPPANNNADRQSGDATGEVKCPTCGKTARLLTVMKDTPNKGRKFYGCVAPCNFFKWADDIASAATAPSTSSASNSDANAQSTSSKY